MLPQPFMKIIKAIKLLGNLLDINFNEYDLGLHQSGMFPVMYVAEVVSNQDPEQEDKVQIFIEGIHDPSIRTLTPWARPFFVQGGSQGTGSSWVPETGDKVWVTFQKPDILQEPYYFAAPQLATTQALSAFESIKSSIGGSQGGGIQSTYPDMKWLMTPSQTTVGMSSSSSTAEMFAYHPSGSSFYIDPDGNVYINSAKSTFITSDDSTVPVAQFGDATYEVACVTENLVPTVIGLQPIQASSRAIIKPKA